MSKQSPQINKIGAELAAWEELRPMLADVEEVDPEAVLDTLEGETELHEAILVVAETILEDDDQLAAVERRIEILGARKARIKNSIETKRQIILSAMDKAGVPSIRGALCTLSVSNTKGKVIIEDEERIPVEYWKRPDPQLDKAAINKAVKDGTAVPGTVMGNGGITLTMRTK